jgi:hypothetical protein
MDFFANAAARTARQTQFRFCSREVDGGYENPGPELNEDSDLRQCAPPLIFFADRGQRSNAAGGRAHEGLSSVCWIVGECRCPPN